MNDAKSMLMMYSYAAMKATEDKEEEKVTNKAKEETKTKADKDDSKQVKTKRRGKKNDKGTERADSTIVKE